MKLPNNYVSEIILNETIYDRLNTVLTISDGLNQI